MGRIFAITGLALLLPSVLCFVETLKSLVNMAQILLAYENGIAGQLLQNTVGTVITQAMYQLYLIPGTVICSLASYKFQVGAKWYWVSLKLYSILMFITPPLQPILGWYIRQLSKLYRN